MSTLKRFWAHLLTAPLLLLAATPLPASANGCLSDLVLCTTNGFPATGQTVAYPADKNDGISGAVPVPDDGTLESGATLSFLDNGDGTITDLRTGLMWEKKGDNGGLHDKDNIYWWSGNGVEETLWDWLEDVNREGIAGFAGYSDWRIPNLRELQTIVDYSRSLFTTPSVFHQNCVPNATVLTGSCTFQSSYWTSTTRADNPNGAWSISFANAAPGATTKASTARVRAVRYACGSPLACPVQLPVTGQTTAYTANRNDGVTAKVPVPDDGTLETGAGFAFVDNGNGTLTDLNTGLTWEKKSDDGGLHDKDRAFYWSGNGTVSQETIWDWLEDVNAEGGTGFAGFSDWRVPNARELESLIRYEGSAPFIAPGLHLGCVPGSTVLTGSCTFNGQHWTSTTWVNSTSMAWGVNFAIGELFPFGKSSALRVRAVRGGTP